MKKRVISAIVMLALIIPVIILGGNYYIVLGCVLGILSLWEIVRLKKDIPSYMQLLSYMVCLLLILYEHETNEYLNIVNFPIIASLFFIYSFSIIINGEIKKYSYKDGLWLMGMTLMIGLMFNSLIKIRLMGIYVILYCVVLSVVTDSFALFGGKLFGKKKLCKEISPNKTIEGSIVGTIFGTIAGSVFYYFLIGGHNIGIIIGLTFLLSIFGQFGDLFFSSIKREHKIKDFSNIIPGHGGILDRLDSLLFIVLGYLLYIIII